MKGALNHFLYKLSRCLPNYPNHRFIYKIFEPIRYLIWKRLLFNIGSNTFIRDKVQLAGFKNITIGCGCFIAIYYIVI